MVIYWIIIFFTKLAFTMWAMNEYEGVGRRPGSTNGNCIGLEGGVKYRGTDDGDMLNFPPESSLSWSTPMAASSSPAWPHVVGS